MWMWAFTRYSMGAVAAAALTACTMGGSSQLPGSSGYIALLQGRQTGHRRAWISPDAKRHTLLYVSYYASNVVGIYAYSKAGKIGALKGQISIDYNPEGLCSDKRGNVYIVDDVSMQVFEYKHGGTTPIKTLSTMGQYPTGCAVDPTTGDLAVTGDCPYTTCIPAAALLVFPGGSGTPKSYACSNIGVAYIFVGYDNSGNLFVDGFNRSLGFGFCELPSGGSDLKNITLNVTPSSPGGVQWDGKYVAIGDGSSTVYQFTVSGKRGTEAGSTSLNGTPAVLQFWIRGSTLVAPDYSNGTVETYHYPAGGSPKQSISGLGQRPYGATVSK